MNLHKLAAIVCLTVLSDSATVALAQNQKETDMTSERFIGPRPRRAEGPAIEPIGNTRLSLSSTMPCRPVCRLAPTGASSSTSHGGGDDVPFTVGEILEEQDCSLS